MLEGITLLSQSSAYNCEGLIIIGVIFAIITLFAGLTALFEQNLGWLVITIICMVICGLGFGFGFGSGKHEVYKVTIADSVNFNEFKNRYNIIDQDGKIYTIIDKSK
jgi:uncharacterized membrane-anchored protein